MEEETLRKLAIEHFLHGKSPVTIYREMGRSKKWFFKWLGRYQSGDADWYRDHSRVPRSHPCRTNLDTRKFVITIRTRLDEHPYAQVGTSAIKWEFKKLGLTPPSDSTINRILRKEGLVKKNRLYPQGCGISLLHAAPGFQQYPSGRPHRATIHQGRRPFLFTQCHGSLQPPGLSSSPTEKRRSSRGSGLDSLLEDHGGARLSPGRQPALFSREQSLPSILWHCVEALSFAGYRSGFHPHWRTLA